jgi:hypothetical protein
MSSAQRPVEELVQRLHATPPVREPAGVRTSRVFRTTAGFAYALGIPAGIMGFAMSDALALALSAGFLGCGFIASDVSRARRGGLSPITMYALTWTLAGFANAAAILNQDSANRYLYFIYAVDQHLPLAMKVAWFGLVGPVLGYRWVMQSPGWRSVSAFLPAVHGEIADRYLLPVALAAAGLGFLTTMTRFLPSLGTLTDFFGYLPHLAAFTLARMGTQRKRPKFVWMALGIAVVEAVRAAMFAYLRSDVLAPIFAYAAGVLMGGRSTTYLKSVYLMPMYALLIPFMAYFAAFAEVRSRAQLGVGRFTVIHEERVAQIEAEESSRQSLLTRLTNFNQLTQVGRVVQEDGYLGGQTLEYLAYAWIPRFIWPEKPVIAKGAWFAHRIGQARMVNGRATNSINMTIPGEFYMNFGWLGLIVGPAAFGIVLALLWQTTGFWEQQYNALGTAFGFYLVWVGLAGGADLQIVVTLVAMYLLFVAAGLTFGRSDATSRGRVTERHGAGIL